jgi:hypothetical protein
VSRLARMFMASRRADADSGFQLPVWSARDMCCDDCDAFGDRIWLGTPAVGRPMECGEVANRWTSACRTLWEQILWVDAWD